jgi:hypothetical protein
MEAWRFLNEGGNRPLLFDGHVVCLSNARMIVLARPGPRSGSGQFKSREHLWQRCDFQPPLVKCFAALVGQYRTRVSATRPFFPPQGCSRILERQKMLQTSQVLFRPLCVSLAVVLPFKDSQGGTWLLNLFNFNWSCLCRHAPVKKQTQHANHAKAFVPHQNFGPAISEAAEPRCATPSGIKLPDTPRWSEARPR